MRTGTPSRVITTVLFDIGKGLVRPFVRTDEAAAANDELHPTGFNRLRTYVDVRVLDGFDQSIEWDVMKTQLVGINFDLVLADIAAHAGNFADSRHGLQLVFHHEVLQASQARPDSFPAVALST